MYVIVYYVALVLSFVISSCLIRRLNHCLIFLSDAAYIFLKVQDIACILYSP